MKYRYASYYISSSGQPHNGYQEHTSKRKAIARARDLRDSLIVGAGGTATAVTLDGTPGESSDTVLYQWREHVDGGYLTVSPSRLGRD